VAPPPFQATEAPLKRGDFTVRFLPALHAPYQFADAEGRSRDILDPLRAWLHARLAGDIDHALPTPTPIMEYKVGDNYLFVIEHARYGTVLVVPSAQVPLRLGGLQVNVVLLGVGDLDKASNEDIRTYWKEAVEDTNAKLVIPIHWDNFFHPLEDGLAPFPPVVDDVACAMETLSFLKSRHVAIRFMLPGEPVKLDAATAQALSDQEAQGAPSGLPDPFKDGCRARRGERRTG
jgi:L-ascorbate metabolism protein UlaG (beta-lactamase superfamily)